MAKQSQDASLRAATLSILFYCLVSIGIVYLNKLLFSGSFQFPVFISWFQQVAGVVIYILIERLGQVYPQLKFFPPYEFNLDTAWNILGLSTMFVGMIASSNLCLKYVLMSTYQVARSLTLIFNVIVTYLLLGQTTSTKCLMACLVVCSGFVVGAMDSMTLSMTGVALGGLSSGFQAVYMVMIKKSLAFVDGDQNRLMTYNMSISSFLFLPIIVLADEIGAFYELPWNINDPAFFAIWPMLIFSAAMGVLIGIASYLCVKCTSPLTFNITGYAKACLQSLGGIIFLGDPVTYNSLGGILLTLFGSFWYSRIRMAESQQPQKQESQGGKRETGGKPEELQKLGGDADATKSSDLDESDR